MLSIFGDNNAKSLTIFDILVIPQMFVRALIFAMQRLTFAL